MQSKYLPFIKKIIFISILVKLIYFVIPYLIVQLNQKLPGNIDLHSLTNMPGNPGILKIFKIHDAGWYEKIATEGYKKTTPEYLYPNEKAGWIQSEYAFFPLFPVIASGLMKILHTDFIISGFILNIILSTCAFIAFFIFTSIYLKDSDKSFIGTLFLILCPFHFYYSALFTESLFLLLLITCFYIIKNKNILLFIISSTLIVLTRPNGVFMAIPLGIYFLEENHPIQKKDLNFIIAFGIFPLTLLGYCFYLKYMTGDFLAFVTAQKGWNKNTTFPFKSLYLDGSIQNQLHSTITILYMLIAILNIKKIPLSFQLLIWISILLPLSAGSAGSMARYISVIFPFSIIIGSYLANFRYKWMFFALLGILHFYSFYLFLMENPITY